MLGLLRPADGPGSLLGWPPRYFFAFVEGVVREDPGLARALDGLYAPQKPSTDDVAAKPDRRREVSRFLASVGMTA